MPNILDVFNGDAYQTVSLTKGILKLPYKPGRLGASGLFQVEGIDTWAVALEYKAGKISLIPTSTRGSGAASALPSERGKLYTFSVPHLQLGGSVTAAECGRREFGSADRIESINKIIQDKGLRLRNNHEATAEYHRIGAIQGNIKDADGSTSIVNLFTTFSISQETVDFALDDDLTEVKLKCEAVRRIIEGKLGGRTHSGIVAQVGNGFWDSLIIHPQVKKAYERMQEGKFLRENQRTAIDVAEVLFCGILFQNYRGKIGTVDFIANAEANFYPTGVQDLFIEHYGPANFVETIGTTGKPFYLKQERMKFDMGVELYSQSNPCVICAEPELLVKGTTALAAEVAAA